jgi:hypothetical protein
MRRIVPAVISPADESGATENVADESSDVENEEDDVETESAEPV